MVLQSSSEFDELLKKRREKDIKQLTEMLLDLKERRDRYREELREYSSCSFDEAERIRRYFIHMIESIDFQLMMIREYLQKLRTDKTN